MKREIQFGSAKIAFAIQRSVRKSMTIHVHPDNEILVMAPMDTDISIIVEKVRTKAPWILKQIAFFNSYKPATKERQYVNGETHLYLGRQYRLKIVPDTTNCIKAYRGQLFIHSSNTSKAALEKQLHEWYKEKASVIFEELIGEIFPKFKKYKINKPILYTRFMSKRWGSCTPSGKIILNSMLVKATKGSIEYVITHELCHLVHYNHNKEFYALQHKMLPDWEKWKERLEQLLA